MPDLRWKNPFDRVVARKLREANEDVGLHPTLDLMLWGLEKADELGVPERERNGLYDKLGILLNYRDPEAALRWLFPEEPGREPDLRPEDLEDMSLEEIAERLLFQLSQRMADTQPYWPPQPLSMNL